MPKHKSLRDKTITIYANEYCCKECDYSVNSKKALYLHKKYSHNKSSIDIDTRVANKLECSNCHSYITRREIRNHRC